MSAFGVSPARVPAAAEICRGDALDIESVRLALEGV